MDKTVVADSTNSYKTSLLSFRVQDNKMWNYVKQFRVQLDLYENCYSSLLLNQEQLKVNDEKILH